MKYYKFWDRFGKLRGGDTYVELDKGYVIRQITIHDGETLASNRKHPTHGFFLPTGYIDYAAYNQLHEQEIKKGLIKPVTTIPKKNFDQVWERHLKAFQEEWERQKMVYTKGKRVTGRVQAFYPQGVVIEIGDGLYGVADYERCRASLGHTLMPKLPIDVTVGGYDDTYQWLILHDPDLTNG